MMEHITWNPVIKPALAALVELEEERNRAVAVLGTEIFGRVREIVEGQPMEKRAAFYGTITEAACAGEDFSQVDSIADIGNIYAQFIVRRTFGN